MRAVPVIPIRIDDALMQATQPWADIRRSRQIGDFREWKTRTPTRKRLSGGFRILKVSEHHSASAMMRLALARRYTQISEAISVPMSVRRGAAYIAEGALQGVLPESSPLKSQNAAKWI